MSASASQQGTTHGTRYVLAGTSVTVYSGTGSPEGAQTGTTGDWYIRADPGTTAPCLYIKRSGTATTTGWVAVDAVGQTLTVEAVTTSKSPTSDESGEVYTNEGDTDGAVVALPTAAANLTYGFYIKAAYVLQISANTGDTIRLGTQVTSAGGSITSDVVGSYVQLLAINATEWVATSIIGEWTL